MAKLRKIIHIDMDCFYAAIEMRENPALKDKPIAVGGSAQNRGVLATCNYAARAFGLHSAMPTAQALKHCPHLVLLPVRMALYKQVSQQIHQIFRRYTDIIEPLSLDEAYLDVTDCQKCSGSATWIAEEIRQAIFNELQLTASAGVAPLKFLAKIASDQNKPNGLFVIEPEQVNEFIAHLPLKKIPGVGKVTNEQLANLGLITCADVQKQELVTLLHHFGKMGKRIWDFSHGIDLREVQVHRERKSIGVEVTLSQNILRIEQSREIMEQLYVELEQRMLKVKPDIALSSYSKMGIKLKFDDFQITSLEKSAVKFEQQTFHQLLQQAWQRSQGRTIRLIGLYVNIPTQLQSKQMCLW
ncbi:DNA polymerase IV [Pasteurellaceae bacterium 22721_9_1]